MLANLDLLRLLNTLKLLDLSTLMLLDLNIVKLLNLDIIKTVPVATKVIKGVVTVYKPNKVIIKVIESTKAFITIIIIDFSLVKANIIIKIAKLFLEVDVNIIIVTLKVIKLLAEVVVTNLY